MPGDGHLQGQGRRAGRRTRGSPACSRTARSSAGHRRERSAHRRRPRSRRAAAAAVDVAQPIVGISRWRVADDHVPFAAQWVDGHRRRRCSAVGSGAAAVATGTSTRSRGSCAAQRRRIDDSADGPDRAARRRRRRARAGARRSRVTVDAGAHMFPATMLWPVSEPNGMLISNGLSTMGFALPAAIGAALARSRPRRSSRSPATAGC